jgi:hypothetical protein
MNRNNFKMDRTAFSSGTMDEESEKHDYSKMTEKEGLQIAAYLISVAYGFVGKPWPKMDRTKFEIVKRNKL